MRMDEEDNENPYEINSFHLSKALNGIMYDLGKKRKLQGEQFGLPTSKHKCWDHRLSPKPLSILEENQEIEDLITHKIQEIAETQAIDDGSDPESAKDSNSFVGDSDSAMSVHGEAKFETEVSKLWHCSGPSSSSLNWVCNNLGDPQCPLDNSAATGSSGNHYNKLHQNLDEAVVDFGSPSDYTCSERGIDGIEPYTDKELDDILYSNGVNPNMYVLSSGRWSVNQDAQPGTRKPTIDQEFEQYFSMLML